MLFVRDNRGRFLKGYSPRLGITLSQQTKDKISKAKKGKTSPTKGIKFSNEIKRNMSLGQKKRKFPIDYHKKISLLGITKQQNSKEPTSIERKVYDYLLHQGILFEKQKLINGRFLVDVYIPDLNLIIEVDGDYWHGSDRVQKKDKAENAYLNKCGFNLIRLSETQINNGTFRERLVM